MNCVWIKAIQSCSGSSAGLWISLGMGFVGAIIYVIIKAYEDK